MQISDIANQSACLGGPGLFNLDATGCVSVITLLLGFDREAAAYVQSLGLKAVAVVLYRLENFRSPEQGSSGDFFWRKLMKLIFSITTLLATTILGACTTTQMAADAMQARFVGKSMDSFVVEHGPPLSEYQMEDGGFLYEWSSGIRKTINLPATTTYSGVANPHSYGGVGQTIGGSPIEMECRLRIITDKHKIIKDFTITKDSIGAWETSRCNEVLSG